MLELSRRHVDTHRQTGVSAQLVPRAQLATALVEYPPPDGNDQASLLCQRDEHVRRYEPPGRVLPTHQRFPPGELPTAQRENRLVVQA